MKILLIQPPIEDFYDTDVRLQPIGLAYLKAAVRKYVPDVEVKIIDFHRGFGRHTVGLPSELKYLRSYYGLKDLSPFCGFHNYYRFGAQSQTMAALIAKEKPHLVGISSLFSPYYQQVLEVAEIVKKVCGCPVVVGGSHASAVPESLLASEAVDYVLQGEGERSFVDLVLALKNKKSVSAIAGLAVKQGTQIKKNPIGENFKLDEIPFPDLSDLNPLNYTYRGRPMTFVISSRSCPHRCSFCSVHTTFGSSYRRRSVENVLEEIRLRYHQGYRVVDFEDDNLTFYKSEMKQLCRRLIQEFPHGDLEFVAMNGISYLSLDVELLKLMRQAGFSRLNLSLVSSDQTVLQTTKRPHTVERYLEIVKAAFELGFQVTSYQILGLPIESLNSQIQTLIFAARQPVLLGASPFYLTPNSPIAKDLKVEISPTQLIRSRLTAMAYETSEVSRDQLYTLFITTRILNFLKGPMKNNLREKRGLWILKNLLQNGIFLADTPEGFQPLVHFDAKLFAQIWQKLEYITKLNGERLNLKTLFADTFLSNAPQEMNSLTDDPEPGLPGLM